MSEGERIFFSGHSRRRPVQLRGSSLPRALSSVLSVCGALATPRKMQLSREWRGRLSLAVTTASPLNSASREAVDQSPTFSLEERKNSTVRWSNIPCRHTTSLLLISFLPQWNLENQGYLEDKKNQERNWTSYKGENGPAHPCSGC